MSSMQVPTDTNTLKHQLEQCCSSYVQTALLSPRRRTKFKIVAMLHIIVQEFVSGR